MNLGGWAAVAVAAGFVLAAVGVLVDLRQGRRAGEGPSGTRIGIGLGITLLATAAASSLIGMDIPTPPEPRGIGVEIVGLGEPVSSRGGDTGLSLAMAVRVTACDDPVRVRVTLAPTAEFWIDNHEALADEAQVRFAVPDELDVDAPLSDALTDLTAWTSGDGLAPFTTAVSTDRTATPVDATATKQRKATFVEVTVPEWGSTMNPLTIEFSADWTRRRSLLGSCYVTLPAVAGLPTMLSTAQLKGNAVRLDEDPPPETLSLFAVSSRQADLKAYYSGPDEVARGVTSLELVDHTLQEEASFPVPDSNLGGDPAWTCRSSIPQSFEFSGVEPGEPATDVFALLDPDASPAFSDRRVAQILRQSTCASFVAVETAGAGTRRDLLLIAIGTVIALGIELTLSGVRRRRPEAA